MNKEELLKRKQHLQEVLDDLDMSSDCGSLDQGDYYGYRRELNDINMKLRKLEEREDENKE